MFFTFSFSSHYFRSSSEMHLHKGIRVKSTVWYACFQHYNEYHKNPQGFYGIHFTLQSQLKWE